MNVSVREGVQGELSPSGQVFFEVSEHQGLHQEPSEGSIPSDSLPPSPSLHQFRHRCDCCSKEMSVSLERQTRGS